MLLLPHLYREQIVIAAWVTSKALESGSVARHPPSQVPCIPPDSPLSPLSKIPQHRKCSGILEKSGAVVRYFSQLTPYNSKCWESHDSSGFSLLPWVWPACSAEVLRGEEDLPAPFSFPAFLEPELHHGRSMCNHHESCTEVRWAWVSEWIFVTGSGVRSWVTLCISACKNMIQETSTH